MNLNKHSLLVFFALLSLSYANSQTKKFPAPASADTIKNPLKGNEASIESGKKIYIQFCTKPDRWSPFLDNHNW